MASTPHAPRLAQLSPPEQYAAIELFRGTMVRHSAIAYRKDRTERRAVRFESEAWLGYIPIRLPDTVIVRERLPAGAAAVLINRNHTYTDLYLAIDSTQEQIFNAIDGEHSIAEICRDRLEPGLVRTFFQQLWRWDQVVFDISRVSAC